MSQALYRKWRPALFDDVIGQEHVTRTLHNSVSADRVGHAYLFCGPRGTGKTTLARLLAKAANCLDEDLARRPCNVCRNCLAVNQGRFLDLIEIDAASNTGVDDIRDLRDKISFAPGEGRFKVYIIDEVHMLSTAAFNALLKTLEEPPPHAKFVLATTEEHKVPLTIKSRCQQFNFRLLSLPEISRRLSWIAEQEGLVIEPEALQLIARHGAGSLRDAESLLDQLVAAPGDAITLKRTQMVLGTASDAMVRTLTDAWLDSDGVSGLQLIHQALTAGVDPRQLCRQMVGYLRQVLLLQAAGTELAIDAPAEQREDMLAQAQRADRDHLVSAIRAFNEAALTPATSWQPQLPLELTFIELLPSTPMPARPMAASESQPTRQPAEIIRPQSPAGEAAVQPSAGASTDSGSPTSVEASFEGADEQVPEALPEEAAGKREHDTQTTTLSLATFKTHWPAMMRSVERRDKNLPALLAMCKPLAVEGNVLVLGFDFPVLKDKFESKPEVVGLVADVFSELIGTPCRVRCVISQQYTPHAPPSPAPQKSRPDRQSDREAFHALAGELGGEVRES